MPLMSPPVVCVTTQDAEEKQDSKAWKSKESSGREGSSKGRGALDAAAHGHAGQAYPIFFFHSASCWRMDFQSPGVTLGT